MVGFQDDKWAGVKWAGVIGARTVLMEPHSNHTGKTMDSPVIRPSRWWFGVYVSLSCRLGVVFIMNQ